MTVDEQSSQDSTLIDDDIVAALGFEPVEAVVDDVVVIDDGAVDDVSDSIDEISTNGDHDGFGIDKVDGLVVDDAQALIEEASLDEELVEGVTADTDVSVDEIAVDEIAVDEADIADVDVSEVDTDDVLAIADVDEAVDATDLDTDTDTDSDTDTDVTDVDVAEIETDVDEAAVDAAELDEAAVDEADLSNEAIESDLDDVPSIADDDLDVDATAPVGLVDLDLDTPNLDTPDLEQLTEDDAQLDVDEVDVIDLDTVDLSDTALDDRDTDEVAADELSAEGFADVEVHELADADSVFADATPVLDPPGFDEPIGLPATETVGQVSTGLLDLDAAEETAGAAAVATAATATKGRRRLRARKSRRVIRHIDPWSVLTFSVLFHMVVFAALLLSSVLVWNAAIASGMVENVESFIQELGDYETFEINADVMFRAAIVIAGMLTLASSVLVVLLTVVFNLISDLVGGIRVTVIEEETVRVPIDKKRSKARNE